MFFDIHKFIGIIQTNQNDFRSVIKSIYHLQYNRSVVYPGQDEVPKNL